MYGAFSRKKFLNLQPNAPVLNPCRIILRPLSEGAGLAGMYSGNNVLGSPSKAIGIEPPGHTELHRFMAVVRGQALAWSVFPVARVSPLARLPP